MFSYYFLHPTYNMIVIIINRRSKKGVDSGDDIILYTYTHRKITTSNRSSASPSVRVGVERHYTVRVPVYRAWPSVEIITTSKLIPSKLYIYIYYICNSGRRQSNDIVVSVGTVYNFISVTLGCRISFLYIYIYILYLRRWTDWTELDFAGVGRDVPGSRLGGPHVKRTSEKFSPYIYFIYI